jgi:hypothetical protein
MVVRGRHAERVFISDPVDLERTRCILGWTVDTEDNWAFESECNEKHKLTKSE